MNDFKVAFLFFLIHSIRSRSSVQAMHICACFPCQHFDVLSELAQPINESYPHILVVGTTPTKLTNQ